MGAVLCHSRAEPAQSSALDRRPVGVRRDHPLLSGRPAFALHRPVRSPDHHRSRLFPGTAGDGCRRAGFPRGRDSFSRWRAGAASRRSPSSAHPVREGRSTDRRSLVRTCAGQALQQGAVRPCPAGRSRTACADRGCRPVGFGRLHGQSLGRVYRSPRQGMGGALHGNDNPRHREGKHRPYPRRPQRDRGKSGRDRSLRRLR